MERGVRRKRPLALTSPSQMSVFAILVTGALCFVSLFPVDGLVLPGQSKLPERVQALLSIARPANQERILSATYSLTE